jgi:hypothetical protein
MKKAMIKNSLWALLAVAAVSCQPGVKVTSDYLHSTDFSSFKSFSLYNLETSRNINQLNEERIWKSIRSEMIRKGYVENSQHPDLLVSAISVLKDKKYLSASSNFFGYGSIYRPYGYWNGGGGMASGSSTVRAYDYKDGSIIIDVVDAKTKRLLWEGTGTSQFEKQPKNPDKAVQSAVAKIMAGFPDGN